MKSVPDPASGLPIGPEIDPAPARRPLNSTVIEGRHVVLAPVDPMAQAETLYADVHGPEADALWLYLSTGPFADRALFRAYLERAAVSEDPLFFSILEQTTGKPVGHATYMRIEPAHRVIEVGNILYTPK